MNFSFITAPSARTNREAVPQSLKPLGTTLAISDLEVRPQAWEETPREMPRLRVREETCGRGDTGCDDYVCCWDLRSQARRQATTLLRSRGLEAAGYTQVGADIDPRNSLFDLVLVSRLSSNSMASTVESGLRTLRSTQTRLSSSGGRRSSSLRVPER
jgi:hypothetical protein